MDNRSESDSAACPHSPGIASCVTDETDPLRDGRPIGEKAACPHPPTLAEMEKDAQPLPATQGESRQRKICRFAFCSEMQLFVAQKCLPKTEAT